MIDTLDKSPDTLDRDTVSRVFIIDGISIGEQRFGTETPRRPVTGFGDIRNGGVWR